MIKIEAKRMAFMVCYVFVMSEWHLNKSYLLDFGDCQWKNWRTHLRKISPFNQQGISNNIQKPWSHIYLKPIIFIRVHPENGLESHLRLKLRPHFINLNEIFRKCVYDTNQNLLFNAIFIHMNQLATNSHFKVYENLVPTLY